MAMKRLGLSLILILALLQPTSAHAASPYDGPPSDIKSFEKTLLESIATISCRYKKGIGFFGTYSLSQESKDKGQNSLIVTNQSLINDCIRTSGEAISIGFNGKNYNSVYSGFNVDGSDLATVISSLSPPKISLYDNYWPKLGSWVYVAYFVESFGIIFRSSKVQLINESTYVIAIDGITPTPAYGGLVFNSDGNFMGTIAMMGPGTAPAGMLKVHGAPLQCEISGIQRATITRCSEGARDKIWTIDPPSGVVAKPTPRPTPTQTTSTVSRELSSAQLTSLQAVKRYESAVEACDAEFDRLDEETLDVVEGFDFLSVCHSLDSDFEEFRSEIEDVDLRSSNISQGIATFGRLSTSIDRLTRDLGAIKSDVAASRSTITAYARTYSEIQGWLEIASEVWPDVENRISKLSKTNQAMIKKNSNFKKAAALVDGLESKNEQISELNDSAASATRISDLKTAVNDGIKLKASLKGYQELNSLVKAIDKLIPAYVCTKGSLVANLPKTGKCAPGYSKVSTK
jgi:hypothetical protein